MILRASEHQEMIWKNGRGITYEIDRYPKNINEEFQWRLSMAKIQYPGGPFSLYPNIDRTLSIMDGKHLTLILNNDQNQLIHLETNSLPYSFAVAGEIPIECRIEEETLTDFNLMTKRDQFKHFVQRFTLTKDQKPINISNVNNQICFIIVKEGILQINQYQMTKGDVYKLIENNQEIQLSTSIDKTILFLVQIIPIVLEQ